MHPRTDGPDHALVQQDGDLDGAEDEGGRAAALAVNVVVWR